MVNFYDEPFLKAQVYQVLKHKNQGKGLVWFSDIGFFIAKQWRKMDKKDNPLEQQNFDCYQILYSTLQKILINCIHCPNFCFKRSVLRKLQRKERTKEQESANSQYKTIENAKITIEKSLLLIFFNLHALYSIQCNKKLVLNKKQHYQLLSATYQEVKTKKQPKDKGNATKPIV